VAVTEQIFKEQKIADDIFVDVSFTEVFFFKSDEK
jgi:hypothetical protein